MNDIVINKIQSIQRCVQRARQEYSSAGEDFANQFTAQDAALLNVLRACEQAIDLANHIIKTHQMGIPTSSAESFELLQKQSVISAELAQKMRKMVHFRNLLIHQYQRLEIEVVQDVIMSGLDDLIEFGDQIMSFEK